MAVDMDPGLLAEPVIGPDPLARPRNDDGGLVQRPERAAADATGRVAASAIAAPRSFATQA
jgi:hypothetical protein